ncbi:MAG: hypothetical protein J2P45_03190 [Candidatus Dormibacteraeota bacterium]|nr:hypothetical protein [Candidatus Dormibacteraeota bacterium]
MTVFVEETEFAGRAPELLEQVGGGGEPVVVLRGGVAVAVLAGPSAIGTGLPRWEEWLHAIRQSFPAAGTKVRPQLSLPEPPAMDKALLGFDPASGCVGSDAGREQLVAELSRLGVPIRDEKLLAEVYGQLLALCEEKDRLYEDDVRLLAQQAVAEAPQRMRLLSVTVTSSTGLPAAAEVTMELGHGPAMRQEHGDGPLDAAFKAIQRLTRLEPEVGNFSVVAATPGRDAMAEAMIELVLAGRRVIGTGGSTNAIEAGVHAYVNALNFLMEEGLRPSGPPGGATTG